MELVILSVIAAVAILVAELREFAGRDRSDRSYRPAAAARGEVPGEHATGYHATNMAPPSSSADLDRAA